MKINEHDYYSQLANWSFDEINYTSENRRYYGIIAKK